MTSGAGAWAIASGLNFPSFRVIGGASGIALGSIAPLAGRDRDLAEGINRLAQEGAPLFAAHVNLGATEAAGDGIARYEIADSLKILLTAAFARHGDLEEKNGATHGYFP